MASSLYSQLNGNPQPNNMVSIISALRNSPNPQQMLLNFAKTNPVVASTLQEIQANGGNAKGLFYKKIHDMGIDPNAILSQLR